MSEMIERVANAIMKLEPDDKISDYYKFARAAIEAMREPTQEMIGVGAANLGDLDVDFAPNSETERGALECWKDMIDAALGKVDA